MKIPGLAPSALDYHRPYFIGDKAGPERYRYVLWVDLMGSQMKMLRNVRTASIPVMKLHVAALNAIGKNTKEPVELYPMIDGIYVVSEQLPPLLFFMSDVYRSMAAEFLVLDNYSRSIIRGALAYGPVIFGRESKDAADILTKSNYSDSVLIGMPLVQSFVAERQAPPFGIYVHESARAFAPPDKKTIHFVLWQWWQTDDVALKIARSLLQELNLYFAWCRQHSVSLSYSPERIDVHQRMAEEYFGEVEQVTNPKK